MFIKSDPNTEAGKSRESLGSARVRGTAVRWMEAGDGDKQTRLAAG